MHVDWKPTQNITGCQCFLQEDWHQIWQLILACTHIFFVINICLYNVKMMTQSSWSKRPNWRAWDVWKGNVRRSKFNLCICITTSKETWELCPSNMRRCLLARRKLLPFACTQCKKCAIHIVKRKVVIHVLYCIAMEVHVSYLCM